MKLELINILHLELLLALSLLKRWPFWDNILIEDTNFFRHRVAEGRKMTDVQVERIAQGHVFSGQDAQKDRIS